MKRRILSIFMAAVLLMGIMPVSSQAAKSKKAKQEAKVTSVKITNTGKKLRMQKGKKFRLKTAISVKPNKKKYKKLKFTSSNKKAVLVNQRGLLKAGKKGTAKITVTSKINPKKKASITVSVTKDVLVNTIKLNRTKITVGEFNEDDIQLEAKKILPSNAKNKKIEWSTSDERVADVDEDGLVTTGDAGTATITAAAADKGGASATCKVTVTESSEEDDATDDPAEVTPPSVEPGTDAGSDSSQSANDPVTPSLGGNGTEGDNPSTVPDTGVKALQLSAVTDWLMPGDSTRIKVTYDPVDTSQTLVNWTFSEKGVYIDNSGKLTIAETFEFDADEVRKPVTVTATSKANPSVSKNITLYVYNPDNTVTPALENPNLTLSEDLAPEWVLKGGYGTTEFNDDGTVDFSSKREDGKQGSVYNNGCAWYLDSRKSRTDVSKYSYVMVTVDTRADQDVKLMTWSGTDDSESFWEKKDYWWDDIFALMYNDDGSTSFIYRTDFVFQNIKNAKSIGITLKSWDGEGSADDNEHFKAANMWLKGIRFTNVLPEESYIIHPDAMNPSAEPLTDPVIALKAEHAPSWVRENLFSTTTYTDDGTAEYQTTDRINNGCAWAFDEEYNQYDVSAYKYISIRLKANAPVKLMTWSANSHPENRFEGKQVATPVQAYTDEDGSQTLVYQTATAFGNPKLARAVGVYLDLDGMTEAGEAEIYEIRFSEDLPDIGVQNYYFTDLHRTLQEDDEHDRQVAAVLDEDGTPCTEIKYSGNNQYAFFELPETLHLSDYESISITANVPGQLVLRGLSESLDVEDEAWYDTYSTFTEYPFQIGSYVDRERDYEPGWNRGTETVQYHIDEDLAGDDSLKYFSIHTYGIPKGGFGYENYFIYSIVLTPRTENARKIVLKSTDENTVAPSAPNPKPSVSSGEVIVPAGDVYEITLSEDNETEATKDKEEYRTDVVFYEDGSVSYTNTRKYNSGMVFRASPDGKKVDLSDFDYIEVTLDGPAEPSLKVFNDASSWWNKAECYNGSEEGHKTIRFLISELERYAVDPTFVDGFSIGFTSDESEGKTVRIYSIRAVKEK